MKTKLVWTALVICCLTATTAVAQNRWGIMGGVNMSTSSSKGFGWQADGSVGGLYNFGWRAGGYIGGLYDIRLTDSWYIQPQLLYAYEENQTKGTSPVDVFYSRHSLVLPVLASFRIPLSREWALRINAGPYVQYDLFGRNRLGYSDENGSVRTGLGWWHADFGKRFTYGVKGGITLEHNHWFVSFDGKYSLKKSFLNANGHGLTLSAGIGYKF